MRKLVVGVAIALIAIAISAVVVSGYTNPFKASAQSGVVGDAQTATPTDSIPYIGVTVSTLSKAKAQELGVAYGVQVLAVDAEGPSANVLQKDDVILSVNGLTVITAADVVKLVRDSNVGDVLSLSVQRGTSTLSLQVTVGTKSLPTPQARPNAKGLVPFFRHFMMPRFNNLWSGQFTFGTDNGSTTVKLLVGTVKSVDTTANTITVTPKDGSADVTFTLDSSTTLVIRPLVIRPGGVNTLGQVQVGDTVEVTTVNDKVTVVIVAGAVPAGESNGNYNRPFHGGFQRGHMGFGNASFEAGVGGASRTLLGQ